MFDLGDLLRIFDPKFGLRDKKDENEFQTFKMTQVEIEKNRDNLEIRGANEKVTVMGDEYTNKDFAYANLRKLHQNEFTGPSLVQLEAKRNNNTTDGNWFDEFDNVMTGKNATGGGRKVMMKGSGGVKMEKDDT